VRRMLAAIGFPVLRLFRWKIGVVTAQGLAPGTWRELNAQELMALQKLASCEER